MRLNETNSNDVEAVASNTGSLATSTDQIRGEDICEYTPIVCEIRPEPREERPEGTTCTVINRPLPAYPIESCPGRPNSIYENEIDNERALPVMQQHAIGHNFDQQNSLTNSISQSFLERWPQDAHDTGRYLGHGAYMDEEHIALEVMQSPAPRAVYEDEEHVGLPVKQPPTPRAARHIQQ